MGGLSHQRAPVRSPRGARFGIWLALLGICALLVFLVSGKGADEGSAVVHDDPSPGVERLREHLGGGDEDVRLAGRPPITGAVEPLDVSLRVIGRFGGPLPDYPVRIQRGEATEERLTDAHGVVHILGVRPDGSVVAHAHPPAKMHPSRARPSVSLRHPDETLNVEEGTLLELDLRDVETGERVEGGRWRYRLHVLQHTSPWHAGRTSTILPFAAGGRALLHLHVEPPEGYVSWDTRRFWVPMEPSARRMRIVHPLRREARITVDATETTDGSHASPVLLGFDAPVRQTEWTWQTADARGLLRVRGLPYLRDGAFRVLVGDLSLTSTYARSPEFVRPDPDDPRTVGRPSGLQGVVSLEGRMGTRWSEDVLVREIVPPVAAREPGPRQNSSDLGTTGWQPDEPGTVFWKDPAAVTLGDVEILVLDRAGKPLPHASVNGGLRHTWVFHTHADAEGRVLLAGCPVCANARVRLSDGRVLPTTVHFDVQSGEPSRVILREPEGARLVVSVVDEEDRAVPYATVRLRQESFDRGHRRRYPWLRWDGDSLIVDHHTDHEGLWSRTLEAQAWTVTASEVAADHTAHWRELFAIRVGSVRVELQDGETREVELVVRPRAR